MLRRAASRNDAIAFNEVQAAHPLVGSVPPDVIWLGRSRGAEILTEGVDDLLPPGELSLEPAEIRQIAETLGTMVVAKPQTYHFWQAAVRERFKGATLASLLMSFAYAAASRVKAKAMTGIVPVIDPYTPG